MTIDKFIEILKTKENLTMAREKRDPESAWIKKVWTSFKEIIGNERGEIGVDDGGDSPEAGSDWNVEGDLSGSESLESQPIPVKEPKKEEVLETEPDVEPEGEKEKGQEKQEVIQDTNEEPVINAEELQTQMAELEGKLKNLEALNKYYETQLQQQTAPIPQKEQETAKEQRQPQQGIQDFEQPPETWESTNQVVEYFDKRNQTQMNQVLQSQVRPVMERFDGAFNVMVDRFIKPQCEGWEETLTDVSKELFVFDSTGEKVVDIKNQGLLKYFQAQPIPQLAMYDYGLNKKAPNKIKDGIEKGLKEGKKSLLTKLSQKPKPPTKLSSEQHSGNSGDLDWDSSTEEVEEKLHKAGLV